MNKRNFERINLEKLNIPIDTINVENFPTKGILKDVSEGGISFYTKTQTLINNWDNKIDVIMMQNKKYVVLEVEILREEKIKKGKTLHAGQFVGVPILVSDNFPLEFISKNEKSLVLI